ncbi:MAG: NPCBM/NEW2 domain-containing protein, partial [Gemmatimonadaceae bacterium]|nr:NPCBM/NEW2 domain-containing protein [Gemmatimonadaceae bacterium]
PPGAGRAPGGAGRRGAAAAVQRWNFLHNIAWYSDPDVLLVRPPMPDGTARAWATLFGLTGQSLMSSDRLTDLPASRVELLRRVFPATDIRPLDLFRPANIRKPIIDLKVHHLGRDYDVVGIFNDSPDSTATRLLSWRALGLDTTATYHVYDFWGGAYYGAWEHGVFVDVPPADVRVVTLVRATDRPVLVSTSRHITQGWVDLLALHSGGTSAHPALSGRSRVIAGDPYTLTIGLPRGAATYRLAAARARGEGRGAPVRVSWATHQGYATVTIASDSTQTVAWDLAFEPSRPYVYPVTSPERIEVTAAGLSSAVVRWPVEYYPRAAYQVAVDGQPVGEAFTPRAVLRGLAPGHTYRLTVRSMWSDGSPARNAAEVTYTPTVPDSALVSDLEPVSVRQDWEQLGRNRAVTGAPLTVGGTTYRTGIGTLSQSEIRYQLWGRFARFTARVGLDDGRRRGAPARAVFEVRGDGRVLWRSDTLARGSAAVPVDVDVRGVRELALAIIPAATPGTDRDDAVPADWLDARLFAADHR